MVTKASVMKELIFITMFLIVTQCVSEYIDTQDDFSNLLGVDISTKLIDFERIAMNIQYMPSGGMVLWRRRLMTVKLAMRAIMDGIEGDFIETVSLFTHLFEYITDFMQTNSSYNSSISRFTLLLDFTSY